MHTKKSRSEILGDISQLASSKGYIFVVAEIVERDFFLDVHEVANINWRERIHNNELALLIGLMLKNKRLNFKELEPRQLEDAIKRTRELLDELHWSYNYNFQESLSKYGTRISELGDAEKSKAFQAVFGTREMIVEPTFYGDAGFYDVQCFELAPKLYQRDLEWLKSNTNFSLAKAKTIYTAIDRMVGALHSARGHEAELLRGKVTEPVPPMRAIDELAFPLDLIVSAAQREDKKISEKDVKSFVDLFSCRPGDQLEGFSEPGHENIFTYKPIIQLSKGVYCVPSKMFLAEAVYKSPLYWMRQDKDYIDQANAHIGAVAEDITYDYFARIFGKRNVYKNVNVIVGRKLVTDIDVMGVLGDTVVIAQNKSKKMTIAALSGDIEAIKNDFKKAVIEPYEQGIKVRNILLRNEPYKLLGQRGHEVSLPDKIKHAYIVCVSNEPYPAVMAQMRAFLPSSDQLPPLQLSLFDLDLVVEYLPDPYDFVFYIKQRLENHADIISSNEIIHLAFHLKYGLFMPRDADLFSLDQSFGQLIDADYYHRKMDTPKPTGENVLQSTWANKEFDKLIEMIKRLDDPQKTDIIFFLMTIPHDHVDAITDHILQAIHRAKDDGYHDFSVAIDNRNKPWGGLTYVIGKSARGIVTRLNRITEMNKYRTQSNYWLGLAASSDGVIRVLSFNDSGWSQSREMDEALAQYLEILKKHSPSP
jgi:hypothetical protein